VSEIKFPKDFLFGTATASYQIEGAISQDGKGPSVWDEFVTRKGKIKNNDSGEIACDHYNKMEEDVKLMSDLSYQAYRFSISWSRIFPTGKKILNQKGLDFYDRLVDNLLRKKIKPFITLFHWDLPLALEKEGGWYSRDTAKYFGDYSNVVVEKLGDRVKNWITLNEPWIILVCGYLLKVFPPGIFKPSSSMKVAHNLLLAHGYGVKAVRENSKNSEVGITNALSPIFSYRLDRYDDSCKRADAIVNKLWLDPILKGEYPEEIKQEVYKQNKNNILEDDLKLISEKIDFVGINNYSRLIVKPFPYPFYNFRPVNPKYPGALFTSMDWEVFPEGIHLLLKRMKNEYGNIPTYITENGVAYYENLHDGKLHDHNRVKFLKDYLFYVNKSILEGVNIKGYFVWSFMDNFEWAQGYEKTFGLVHIDRKTLKRTPKLSAEWYSNLCKKNSYSYLDEE
jgi:beta-glucosidase